MKHALALVTALAVTAGIALAGTEQAPSPAAKGSAGFETLKKLEGTWTGKAGPAGGESSDATVVYKVIGAGSALEERLFPGTPHEMVTMYHMDGDGIVLTHYCAAGNQPRMKLASIEGNSFSFKFAGGTNIQEGGMHMHDAKITLVDVDHMKAEWTSWSGGKVTNTMVFDLARKK